jgi:hypothetical protein
LLSTTDDSIRATFWLFFIFFDWMWFG